MSKGHGLGPFVWVALTALALVLVVVMVQFFAPDSAPAPQVVEPAIAQDHQSAPQAPPRRPLRPPKSAPVPKVEDAGGQKITGRAAPLDMTKLRPGVALYRDQALADRRSLGDADFADMERLWKEARFGGHSPQAFKAFEELIDKYGDSHRASCARYLLARERLGHGSEPIEQRREQAASLLQGMVDADSDTRCEWGSQASNLSRLLLATQVYRYTDWDRSLQTLQELSRSPEDQVDSMGQSLARRAQRILQEVEEKN